MNGNFGVIYTFGASMMYLMDIRVCAIEPTCSRADKRYSPISRFRAYRAS